MPGNGTMTSEERENYHFQCICYSSVDYAKRYIKQASIETLMRCLEHIKGRRSSKTLRGLILRRVAQIEREANYGAVA